MVLKGEGERKCEKRWGKKRNRKFNAGYAIYRTAARCMLAVGKGEEKLNLKRGENCKEDDITTLNTFADV